MNYKSNEPCICCGLNRENSVCYHHLYSRKAYPEFKNFRWNMIPVCQKHHNEFHSKPLTQMAKKYNSVNEWLLSNGWEIDSFLLKWVHVG